jgi:hypothetical protein
MKIHPSPGSRLLLATVVSCLPATAAPIIWIGGNVDWVDASGSADWSPADEPDPGDEAIFNTPNTVHLGSANSILALSLSGGIDLLTNDHDLTVDGLVQLAGASTILTIGNGDSLLTADSVTVNSGGLVKLDGGTLTVIEETGIGLLDINAGASLSGQGTVNLDSTVAGLTTLISIDGTLSAAPPGPLLGSPPAGTLAINLADTLNGRIDLDGLSGNSTINISRNQTLDLNGLFSDAFSGDLNLYQNSTFETAGGWTMDSGTIDVDNGFIDGVFPAPDVAAGSAFLSGGAFTQTGGTITNSDGDGTLQFDAPFTLSGGNLVNHGRFVFNADTTIGAAANFTMPSVTSSLTINAGVTVNVDQAGFDADGLDAATNAITIQSGGVLDLDLGFGGDDSIGGAITLNGGELDVTAASTDWWIDGGSLIVGAATGTSQINGDMVYFNDLPVSVGAGSRLEVNASSSWESTASVTVASGGTLQLAGSGGTPYSPDLDIVFDGASFTGAGTLVLASTSWVKRPTTIATGSFDWDGTGTGAGISHLIEFNFTITSPVFDTDGDMDAEIILAVPGSTLTVSGPSEWTMRDTLTTVFSGSGYDPAYINGTSRMILAGTTGILKVEGNTTIHAPLTYGEQSSTLIVAGQTLRAKGDTIHDGGDITGPGTYLPAPVNTVTGISLIDVGTIDLDAGSWTIDDTSSLHVDAVDYDTSAVNEFNNTMTVDGSFSIHVDDPQFVMDGTLNLNAGTWQGSPLHLGNDSSTTRAALNIGGVLPSTYVHPVTFFSDADVTIAAGATLHHSGVGPLFFNTVNGSDHASFTGAGTLSTSGTVHFNEAVTFNMSGGSIDLDGSGTTGNLVNVDAPVLMNLASLQSFGKVNESGSNLLEIDQIAGTGSLTVNLDDPAAWWTLNAPGVLGLINGNTAATLLAGADIRLNGRLDITGDVRTTARVDIGGTVNLLTAGEPLRLGGGAIGSDPNTLAGGTINGPGLLGCDTGTSLAGFGTIGADIDFDGVSDLRANNGTLTVTSSILDARNVGTADSDGIFNVVNPWNSASVVTVSLFGGELAGGAVILDNPLGLSGSGIVSARVINNTRIGESGPAATLRLETAAHDNDWDGGTGNGTLAADAGILELRDTATFPFSGTVEATGGGTVFANGFALAFNAGSAINLTGGTYKSTGTTELAGAVTTNPGPPSVLEVQAGAMLDFKPTSTTTLNANLQLVTNDGLIRAGATFIGSGALVIPAVSSVGPGAGANLQVLVANSGSLMVGALGVGRNDAKDFQQSATGRLLFDLAGTALSLFDRLVVAGAAQLGGTLELDLDGGFSPALGQTYGILTASAGVSGTFASVIQPATMPAGLKFRVNYLPNLVQLEVVAKTPYELWIDSFAALTNPADKLKAANPDHDALDNLGEFALDGDPASGASPGKIVGKIAAVGGVDAMTLTFPVRTGALPDLADPAGGQRVLKQTADGLFYTIQASDDLAAFPLDVTEVVGADATAIQAGLPAVHPGWVYRTFRSPGPVAGDPSEFMRVMIGE